MKYCKNGNHRYHVRAKMVEQLNGDAGWLCPGEEKWKRDAEFLASEKRFLAVMKGANEIERKRLAAEKRRKRK